MIVDVEFLGNTIHHELSDTQTIEDAPTKKNINSQSL